MDGQLLKERGRPRKTDGRVRDMHVRLTDDEMREIEHFSGRYECTYSDILRMALDEFVRSRRVKT